MKKKIAVILTGIMLIASTGCSLNGSEGIDAKLAKTEDIFTEISEESNVENTVASDAFSKALEAVNSSDNITIKVSNRITMGTEGTEGYQDSLNESLVKIGKDGDKSTGNVVIDNTYVNSGADGKPAEEKSKITGTYADDALYFITNDGDKVKEEMGFDDFMSVVNTYSVSLYTDCIARAACVESKKSKTYYIAYDPAAFETTMNTNIEASGQTFDDGEAMHVKYANVIAELDNDDNLKSYVFVINAEYVTDTETTPYNYEIKTVVKDKDSTVVEPVEDKEDYMSTDEYTKLLQDRIMESEEASGSELVTDGAEAGADDAEAGADTAEAGTQAQ